MKTRTHISTALFFAALFITANSAIAGKTPHFKTTESGIEYCILKKGSAEAVQKSYRLFFSYTTYLNNDTVIFDASAPGKPFVFIVGEREGLPGWDEALLLMHVGDSAVFKIPAVLAYGSKRVGRIPANSTLTLRVKLYKQEQAYFNVNGLLAQKLDTLLHKYLVQSSEGTAVQNFQELTMAFTGYIKEEGGYRRIFQSSQTNSNKAIFQLGVGRMVKGLELGLATMHVGEKATFEIAPEWAFGNEKNGIIPPNSTLYFDIEILAAKDPFFQAGKADTITTEKGIKIVKLKDTTGNLITVDQVAKMQCVTYYIDSLNHKILLSNTRDANIPVNGRAGARNSLMGLTLGLEQLRKGEKAIVIIPYKADLSGAINQEKIKFICHDVEVLDVFAYPFFDGTSKDTLQLADGLRYILVREGAGEQVRDSASVTFAYTGYIINKDGKRVIFDASRENGRLLNFTLGKNEVISGFEKGISGMKVGEGRTLIIPPAMGYGEKGIPSAGIPSNATLFFDVELINIATHTQQASN